MSVRSRILCQKRQSKILKTSLEKRHPKNLFQQYHFQSQVYLFITFADARD